MRISNGNRSSRLNKNNENKISSNIKLNSAKIEQDIKYFQFHFNFSKGYNHAKFFKKKKSFVKAQNNNVLTKAMKMMIILRCYNSVYV